MKGKEGQYHLQGDIETGAFSTVIKAEKIDAKELVAVKCIQKSISAGEEYFNKIKLEIEIMLKIKNKYCVCFVDAAATKEVIYIAMEFCDGFSDKGPDMYWAIYGTIFQENEIKKAIFDVLHGLLYLHNELHVCHRDIKPQNILYHTKSDCWKVADFGETTYFDPQNPTITGNVGTFVYQAPEIIGEPTYTERVDCWSTGVTAWEAFVKPKKLSEKEWRAKVQISNPLDDEEASEEAKDFVAKMLKKKEERMTVKEALEHRWIKF